MHASDLGAADDSADAQSGGGGATSARPVLRASLGCQVLEARENPDAAAHTGWYAFQDAATHQPVFAYVASDAHTPVDTTPASQLSWQPTIAVNALQNSQPDDTSLWTDWQNAVFVDVAGNPLTYQPTVPASAAQLVAASPSVNLASNENPAPQPPAPQPPAPQPPGTTTIQVPAGGTYQTIDGTYMFPQGGTIYVLPGGRVVVIAGAGGATFTPKPDPTTGPGTPTQIAPGGGRGYPTGGGGTITGPDGSVITVTPGAGVQPPAPQPPQNPAPPRGTPPWLDILNIITGAPV